MKIEISESIVNKNDELNKFSIKSIPKYLHLSLYIIFRKLWRPQILALILFGIATATLLLTLFYYDLQMHSLLRSERKRFPNYYDDGSRDGWPFETAKKYDASMLRKWSNPHYSIVRNALSSSQGENGTAFIPTAAMKPLMDELLKKHNYNFLASQMISLHRSVPDLRFPECRDLIYPEELPTTSVIIIFHNEALSTLLRTIWSIVNRSPHQLIKEIILVDDFSTETLLRQPLYDSTRSMPVNVKILRNDKREGLIRSRLIGAKIASGSVLTFFDSHIECTNGWLQPLLSRIAADRSVVAVPVIDRIRASDMAYTTYSDFFSMNGFRWHLIFSNMSIPERERLRTNYDRTAPLRTPTHIGCAFSIDRELFFEIGSYDEQMDIWGSENLEMALRVWQCGGSMEIMPCSRIGHLFRISTYSFDGDSSVIKDRNNVRLIEVWMRDLKHLIYAANPKSKTVSSGDLSTRFAIRDKFKCKSFRWYLEHVYPESNLLKEYSFVGEIVSLWDDSCLDIFTARLNDPLATFGCHKLGGNQFFGLTAIGQMVTAEELCVGIPHDKNTVIQVQCSEKDSSQIWKYDEKNKWLQHDETRLCLKNDMGKAVLSICDSLAKQTKWKLSSTN